MCFGSKKSSEQPQLPRPAPIPANDPIDTDKLPKDGSPKLSDPFMTPRTSGNTGLAIPL
jgi:hypothetical protein